MIQSEFKRTQAGKLGKKEAAFAPQRFHPLLDAGTRSARGAGGKGNVKACVVQAFFLLVSLLESPLLEEEAPC